MRSFLSRSVLVSFVALALIGCGASSANCPETTTTAASATLREPNGAPESIAVTIGGLEANDRVPLTSVFGGFGCEGQNQSLAIEWAPVEGAQSYAVVVHDPDAPTGVGFFHWVALDIPASTVSLPLGASGSAMPTGTVEAYTDFGINGYGGPCPPPGDPHRYEVTVYAVDVPSLGIPSGATGALARFALRGHTIALGRATAIYGR
jgi:Raf kinase inhibitor-like YbhB/YbcL family protein